MPQWPDTDDPRPGAVAIDWMVIDHDESPAIAADADDPPIGIASVDLPLAVSCPQSSFSLRAPQPALGEPPLRVRSPIDPLDHPPSRGWSEEIRPPSQFAMGDEAQPPRSTSSMR